MKLHIKEILGIAEAEVELIPGAVVEVIGPNEAGKTSFAVAASAVLAREGNPLALPVALTRKAYLYGGSKEGLVTLTEGGATVEWNPAAGTMTSPVGGPYAKPASVREAVGLVDFTSRRDAKERAAVIQSVLLPDPSEVLARLKGALANLLSPSDLAGVLEMVRARGWKPAEGVYVERMRVSKRGWEGVTGQKYGIKVAADWRPGHWRAELDSKTTIEAEADVTTARDALAALNRVDAISEAERQTAVDAKASIPGLEEELRATQETAEGTKLIRQEAFDAFQKANVRVQTVRATTPRGIVKPLVEACPHCEGALVVEPGGKLRKFDVADFEAATARIEAERAGIRDEIRKLQALADEAEKRHVEADRVYTTSRTISQRAKYALDQAVATAARAGVEVDSATRQRALASAEEEVEARKADVSMVRATTAATDHHKSVMAYERIVKALGPRGVRALMVAKRLETLSKGLDALTTTAGWPAVKVTDKGEISYNSRPIALCSESAQWRTQACLQLSFAAMTNSAAVILDRADLLDKYNRAGLAKVAERVTAKRPIAVLLCSTGEPSSEAPWPQVQIDMGMTIPFLNAGPKS